ncbi:MAG: O-antigen ligase family protein [Thermoproteota archaeon]
MKIEHSRNQSKYNIRINDIGIWLFVLFLFAGAYKADPRVAFIQERIDITLLFMSLSLLVSLYLLLKNQLVLRLPARFIKIAFLFTLLAIWLASGLLYSDSKQYGNEKVLKFIITGWSLFGVAFLIIDFRSLLSFSWSIAVLSTIMAYDASVNYLRSEGGLFVTAFSSNYIALSRIAGFGFLVITMFLLPVERRKTIRLGLWGLAIWHLWTLLTSGARGPVIALPLSFLIFLLMIFSLRISSSVPTGRRTVYIPAVMILALLLVGIFGRELFPILFSRLQSLGEDQSTLIRRDLYREAIALWLQSPVWGIGTGAFGTAFIGVDKRLYPHNVILELAVETGIIGVFIFAIMMVNVCVKSISMLKSKNGPDEFTARYLTLIYWFAFLNAMVSGDINDNRLLFVCMALLGISDRFSPKREMNFYLKSQDGS